MAKYAEQIDTIKVREEMIMLDLLERIQSADDPVDQWKLMERYHLFIKCRGDRLDSERSCG